MQIVLPRAFIREAVDDDSTKRSDKCRHVFSAVLRCGRLSQLDLTLMHPTGALQRIRGRPPTQLTCAHNCSVARATRDLHVYVHMLHAGTGAGTFASLQRAGSDWAHLQLRLNCERPLAPSVTVLQDVVRTRPQTDQARLMSSADSPAFQTLADARFDPLTCFPNFPVRQSQIQDAEALKCSAFLRDASPGSADSSAALHPPAFVPVTAQGDGPFPLLWPRSYAAQERAAASLPLDLFDSTEHDLVSPAELLAQAAAAAPHGGGARALICHYNVDVRAKVLACGR